MATSKKSPSKFASNESASKKSAFKSTTKSTSSKKSSGKKSTTPPSKRWSAKVTTDSTKPDPGIFTKGAKEIADDLVKKSVSPKGPGQAMQMLSFYENRGGKNLSTERKKTLESAKDLIREKEGRKSVKTPVKKAVNKKSIKKSASKSASKKASQ